MSSQSVGYDAPARIKVIGVGGGGNNAINRMLLAGIEGATFAAVNTDRLVLDGSQANETLVIGEKLTKGLGAGANPEIGAQAAEETKEQLKELLKGVDMLFITAGMGGGTGTGAAPIIAQIACEMEILTVAIVTKPFDFEGNRRMKNALMGIEKLREYVDTLLVIPNQKLLETYPDLEQAEAFVKADEVLRNAVMGLTDIIVKPTMVNLDFADVRTVMKNAGLAHMGIGEAVGPDENLMLTAVRNAVLCPLLETNISGATGVILNFINPSNTKLSQINEAVRLVQEVVDPDANIIWGQGFNEPGEERAQVTIIATGFTGEKNATKLREIDNKVEQPAQRVEQPVRPQVTLDRQEAPVQQSAPQVKQDTGAREMSAFEKEVATHPAFANMIPAAKAMLDVIEQKVKVLRDPSIPKFLKNAAKDDLKECGIRIDLL